ncbi:MAG: ChaN family lipoprotein [Phycisphaerales bacterium]|jgi:uncharacterized iron-regulated protein
MRTPILLAALALACAGSSACSRPDPFAGRPADPSSKAQLLPSQPFAPRALPMFSGHDGRVVTWADLMDAAARSDVVILGEQHDDAVGHAVELAVVSDVLASFPGSALSLEMLERHEQDEVDAYLAGELELAAFVEATGSENWSGKQRWEDSYGRLVEAAKRTGSRVIAANAPRSYVRLAGREGYDALRSLPPEERALFDLPDALDDGAYRARLVELMTEARGEPPTDEQVERALRPQMVWDATMARSIAKALDARPNGAAKVVHVIGRFHSDFDGGTVLELSKAAPFARILVISLCDASSRELAADDAGRADIVVYTGLGAE